MNLKETEEVIGLLNSLKTDIERRLAPMLANAQEEARLSAQSMGAILDKVIGTEFEHDAQALMNLLELIFNEMETVTGRVSVAPDQTSDLINFVHG